MSILGDAKNRLKSSGITYPGWEEREDIYGNRVAPGGITNYRLPSFGGVGVIGGASEEQQCVANGGTWDPVNRVCHLPSGESVEAPEPNNFYEDLDQAYIDAVNWQGFQEGSITDRVNVAAGRNPQHGGFGQNDPAFAAVGFTPINTGADGTYRTSGYGEAGRITGPLTVNKQTALNAGDWYSAFKAGATIEEIAEAGGPKPDKTAELIADVADNLLGGAANAFFEQFTGKDVKTLILEGSTHQQIYDELKAIPGGQVDPAVEDAVAKEVANEAGAAPIDPALKETL